MAAAVNVLWPEAKFGVGPVIDDGFYYDIDLGKTKISEEDFKKIEKTMKSIVDKAMPFEKKVVSIAEALEWAKDSGQPYKQELINDLMRFGTTSVKDIDLEELGMPSNMAKVKDVTLYSIGNFTDLCRGPHIDNTSDAGTYKIMRIAGAYWRGKETNPQMQRLYGVAFKNKQDLDSYLIMLEEAKKRDHRKLGEELELFTFSPLVGKGLPLWLERGATLRRELERFIVDEEIKRGYKHVITPDIANLDLYKKSGHYPYYKDSMYAPIEIDEEQFMLRPMSCPHHFEIYKSKPRSYKELPMRIAELVKLYRYEKSGELNGLTRVRSFCLADSHIICTKEQAKQEIIGALELIEFSADLFGLKKGKDYSYRLSLGDRDDDSKYFKDDEAWDYSEEVLRQILSERQDPYIEVEAEAAFYGPKIDIQMKNVLGKEDTAFTVQYDFVMPKRFNLVYTDADDQQKEAVVIHRSSIGAIERLIAFLIEHYSGKFPVWMAPEQIRIATVNQSDEILQFANKIFLEAQALNLRVFIDDTNESVGKKIRQAETMKIPYLIVLGDKELHSGEVTPRIRSDMQVQASTALKIENFLKTVSNEAKSRVRHTSM
jgi:threonyl-tRNA synthetase